MKVFNARTLSYPVSALLTSVQKEQAAELYDTPEQVYTVIQQNLLALTSVRRIEHYIERAMETSGYSYQNVTEEMFRDHLPDIVSCLLPHDCLARRVLSYEPDRQSIIQRVLRNAEHTASIDRRSFIMREIENAYSDVYDDEKAEKNAERVRMIRCTVDADLYKAWNCQELHPDEDENIEEYKDLINSGC